MKHYTGINIQYPISQLILSGEKTIETRTYKCPIALLDKPVLLIETPGRSGKFKARAVALAKFTSCFEYKNESQFYRDSKRHFVTRDSQWKWKDKTKWGWEIELISIFKTPQTISQPKGIRYTNNIPCEF